MKHPGLARLAPILALALASGSVSGAAIGDGNRFGAEGRLTGSDAHWIATDAERLVFGSGQSLSVTRLEPAPRLLLRHELDIEITAAAVAQDRLYAVERGSRVVVLDLERPHRRHVPPALRVEPGTTVRLARMGDYLLLAEEGRGLRIVELPSANKAMGPGGYLRRVGFLPFERPLSSVTGAAGKVYLGLGTGGLAEIDAADPARPSLVRTIEIGVVPLALAANGSKVFLLAEDGLRLLELPRQGEPRLSAPYTEVQGSALTFAGRTLHVAARDLGLTTFRDHSAKAMTIDVTVTDHVFTPQSVTVDVGDTVRWTNLAGFHNVESCDGASDPPACAGQVAAEGAFISGPPQFPGGSSWPFEQTFTQEGDNPYFCLQHVVSFGESGLVRVNDVTPPGVPDGTNGAPLTVDKLDATATALIVDWDTATCDGAAEHQIVFGGGSLLPGSPGAVYGTGGASCAIGDSSPFTWTGSPDPLTDPTGLIWFLVLANDDATVEGSWGKDGVGSERSGPGTGGSSARCGMTDKDLDNVCGQ